MKLVSSSHLTRHQWPLESAEALASHLARIEDQWAYHYRSRSTTARAPVAVFDADGTLWPGDVGDGFVDFQIREGLFTAESHQQLIDSLAIQLAQEQGPRDGAELLPVNVDAYKDLASIYADTLIQKGASEQATDELLKMYLQKEAPPCFAPMEFLVDMLLSRSWGVYVVSASFWPTVRACVQRLGIDPNCVLAAKLKVTEEGRFSSEFAYPLPYKEKKVEALCQHEVDAYEVAAGNSMGDWALLAQAREFRVVVSSAGPQSRYYSTERSLIKTLEEQALPATVRLDLAPLVASV